MNIPYPLMLSKCKSCAQSYSAHLSLLFAFFLFLEPRKALSASVKYISALSEIIANSGDGGVRIKTVSNKLLYSLRLFYFFH